MLELAILLSSIISFIAGIVVANVFRYISDIKFKQQVDKFYKENKIRW